MPNLSHTLKDLSHSTASFRLTKATAALPEARKACARADAAHLAATAHLLDETVEHPEWREEICKACGRMTLRARTRRVGRSSGIGSRRSRCWSGRRGRSGWRGRIGNGGRSNWGGRRGSWLRRRGGGGRFMGMGTGRRESGRSPWEGVAGRGLSMARSEPCRITLLHRLTELHPLVCRVIVHLRCVNTVLPSPGAMTC